MISYLKDLSELERRTFTPEPAEPAPCLKICSYILSKQNDKLQES